MQQEAADTFVGVECHGLDTIALTPVAVGEADPAGTHVEEPVVRDGDAMRIAAHIGQDVSRASEGRLGIDDPLFGIALIAKLDKALREGHGAGGVCPGQRRAALAAKDGAQGPPRKEDAGISLDPALPIGGKRASCNDTVDRAMCP
jgi:hypothetical protein